MKKLIVKLVLVLMVFSQMGCGIFEDDCPGAHYVGEDSGLTFDAKFKGKRTSRESGADCLLATESFNVLKPDGTPVEFKSGDQNYMPKDPESFIAYFSEFDGLYHDGVLANMSLLMTWQHQPNVVPTETKVEVYIFDKNEVGTIKNKFVTMDLQ